MEAPVGRWEVKEKQASPEADRDGSLDSVEQCFAVPGAEKIPRNGSEMGEARNCKVSRG